MSNYPPGTEHDPNAPWNQKDVEYETCQYCDEGMITIASEKFHCNVCEGRGETPINLEVREDQLSDYLYEQEKDRRMDDIWDLIIDKDMNR